MKEKKDEFKSFLEVSEEEYRKRMKLDDNEMERIKGGKKEEGKRKKRRK